jgi:hypothetical protein
MFVGGAAVQDGVDGLAGRNGAFKARRKRTDRWWQHRLRYRSIDRTVARQKNLALYPI